MESAAPMTLSNMVFTLITCVFITSMTYPNGPRSCSSARFTRSLALFISGRIEQNKRRGHPPDLPSICTHNTHKRAPVIMRTTDNPCSDPCLRCKRR